MSMNRRTSVIYCCGASFAILLCGISCIRLSSSIHCGRNDKCRIDEARLKKLEKVHVGTFPQSMDIYDFGIWFNDKIKESKLGGDCLLSLHIDVIDCNSRRLLTLNVQDVVMEMAPGLFEYMGIEYRGGDIGAILGKMNLRQILFAVASSYSVDVDYGLRIELAFGVKTNCYITPGENIGDRAESALGDGL